MCTVFTVNSNGKMLIAKNYDNFVKNGMIFTNKRGMKKQSLTMPNEKKLNWISKYGSITFSQCGKGMPVNGMNEKGLVVEQATLPGTLYLEKDERPEISCLETIQFLLDTCSSVNEAIQHFNLFRISRNSWTLHYYITDSSGSSAIIEFINGNMIVYEKSQMPVSAITNTQYSCAINRRTSLENNSLNEYEENSIERFEKIKKILKNREDIPVNECFNILNKIKRNDTVWSCVYDITRKEIFLTSIYFNEISKIKMEEIDFSETSESMLCNIESINCSDLRFSNYSKEANRINIEGFFKNEIIIKMMNLPSSEFIIDAFDQHINYIEDLNQK